MEPIVHNLQEEVAEVPQVWEEMGMGQVVGTEEMELK
jgi:hypothetical protein